MTSSQNYNTPLSSRYASEEMSALFSKESKYTTWRQLWLSLAKAQKKAGLSIEKDALDQMEKHVDKIDFKRALQLEEKYKHEVIAHIHAYAHDAPKAQGMIHLGATSSYVMDGGDLILFKKALEMVQGKLKLLLMNMAQWAQKYKSLACIGYTHFQIAQPTTIGKRLCSYLQDLFFCYKDLKLLIDDFPFIGVKGATGTQASFLKLFDGDIEKVKMIEKDVADSFGFTKLFPIVTQTYPRIHDARILSLLARIGAAAHKFGTDLRLLAHTKEVYEPLALHQVGSSAMPHKCNPIRSERLCSLARYLMQSEKSALETASLQWLERSLDDSAIRRMVMPEAFLCCDSLLHLMNMLVETVIVDEAEVSLQLEKALPLVKMEMILMEACKLGHDREKVHEMLLKSHQRHQADSSHPFDQKMGLDVEKIASSIKVEGLIGAAPQQVDHFLNDVLFPEIETDNVKPLYMDIVKK